MTELTIRNGPYFHIHTKECENQHFHDFVIHVDAVGQLQLGKLLSGGVSKVFGHKTSFQAPFYPLNTDGIDPRGRNILIERVNITNYDDAIAVKPVYDKDSKTDIKCTENVMVRDLIVHWSTGLAIGSVHPADSYGCIRNVTFRDSVLYSPFKGIYIKTNSGTTTSMLPGSGGEITNITYENIEIYNPSWWGIYIGPQQQHEPNG